ncbi:MAG: hypothetical protein K0S11_1080 [Gammaproteobacteria bacterium]|jgi:hypothetical protein|nr:hypothetical protein [Gammaproteobacteria bacterium]
MTIELSKIKPKTAAEVYTQLQFKDKQAATLLVPEQTPQAFLQALLEAKFYADAAQFLAHALPKREAVWWACLCIYNTVGDKVLPAVKTALLTVQQWVREPTEEHRRATQAIAEQLGYELPVSWVGLAAFWSGGSITPPEAPVVNPGESLTAHAVTGAIMLAAVSQEPQHAAKKYQQFLQQGLLIAQGKTGIN